MSKKCLGSFTNSIPAAFIWLFECFVHLALSTLNCLPLAGAAERTELKFYEEERIPEHLRAKLADFKTTKDYAKGHQRPAADTKYSMV